MVVELTEDQIAILLQMIKELKEFNDEIRKAVIDAENSIG